MAIWGSRFSNIAVVASCQTHSGITGNWFPQRFFQWTLPFSTVLAKHMSRFSRLNWSFLNNHHFLQLPTISSDQKVVTQPSTGRIGDIGTRRFQGSRRSLASFLCRLEVRPWNKIVLISQNPSKTTQKPRKSINMNQNQPPTMIQHQPESCVLQTYDLYSPLTNAPTLVGSKKRFQINGPDIFFHPKPLVDLGWCWLLWNFNTYDMLLLFHIIPIIPIYVLQTTIVIHCTSLYYRFFIEFLNVSSFSMSRAYRGGQI